MSLLLSFSAFGQEISEEDRLKGFAEHKRKQEAFDQQRQVGTDDVKKKREAWEKEREKAVEPYKVWKSKQVTAPDENSPEYKQDLAIKEKREQEHEKARLEYVRQRDAKRARKQSNIRLSEEEEYDLSTDLSNRVDSRKRKNAEGRGGGSSGRTSSPGMGSADFGSPPPIDYSSPPPPPPPPEFYEPEIQPPPPPDADFGDPIPPPVFDEPSDM